MRDPEEYVELVLSVVEKVPRGRVTSYGAIAAVVGGGPRQVGAVMSRHGAPVPWWRVVRADGSLPPSHEENARPHYLDEGLLRASPFVTIDEEGVGDLVARAVDGARRSRPGIPVGVCGEHAGDPASIGFLAGVGVSYLSCSPFRVPVARLEAARAAVLAEGCPPDRFDELDVPVLATVG